MRKIAPIFLLLSLLLVTTRPLAAQESRPRRVGQTTSTTSTKPAAEPTVTTPAPTPAKNPPVLRTGTTTSTSKQPSSTTKAPASTAYEPEEVDEGDVVRVSTNLVTIPVTVMDHNGRFIPDLRQHEFRIFEEGVEHSVAYFATVEKPFTVALVIDTSASTRFRLDEIQEAAIAFVNQLRPEDRVMVVSFDEEIKILAEATSDRYVLREAIRRTHTGGGTRLYDAVDIVINQRLNRESGRKAIVLFTDGVDTTSRRANYESNMRDAEELDALIYPIQYDTYNDIAGGGGGGGSWPSRYPSRRRSSGSILADILGSIIVGGGGTIVLGGGRGGPGTSPEDYRRANAYLNDLANKTGARLYRADTTRDLSQAFGFIAEELRRQYSLGYYPKSQAQAGQRRQIRVRVMRPDLIVRARDSYIVGNSTGATTAQTNGGQQPQSKPELRKRP